MESKIEKLKGKYYIYPKNSKDEVVEYLNALCEKQNEIIDHLNSQAQPEEEYRYLNGDKPIKDRRIIEFMEGLPERVWEDTTEEWSWKFLKGGCEPEEVDKVIDFIKQEKEKSRKETLEEVKGKFGGGVIIGIGDNDLGVKVPEIRVPELDKWVEEELSKLNK